MGLVIDSLLPKVVVSEELYIVSEELYVVFEVLKYVSVKLEIFPWRVDHSETSILTAKRVSLDHAR